MTHIPEVLEVMEGGDNSTSKKTERVLRVPYILVVFVSIIFLLSLLVSTFLFYKYMSCCDENSPRATEYETDLKALKNFQPTKSTKNVRLPRAVVPDSYKLKIIPFIWEGKMSLFTLAASFSVTTDNVTESLATRDSTPRRRVFRVQTINDYAAD